MRSSKLSEEAAEEPQNADLLTTDESDSEASDDCRSLDGRTQSRLLERDDIQAVAQSMEPRTKQGGMNMVNEVPIIQRLTSINSLIKALQKKTQ